MDEQNGDGIPSILPATPFPYAVDTLARMQSCGVHEPKDPRAPTWMHTFDLWLVVQLRNMANQYNFSNESAEHVFHYTILLASHHFRLWRKFWGKKNALLLLIIPYPQTFCGEVNTGLEQVDEMILGGKSILFMALCISKSRSICIICIYINIYI